MSALPPCDEPNLRHLRSLSFRPVPCTLILLSRGGALQQRRRAGEEEMRCRVEGSGDSGQGLPVVQKTRGTGGQIEAEQSVNLITRLITTYRLDEWRKRVITFLFSALLSTCMCAFSALEHNSVMLTVDPSRVMACRGSTSADCRLLMGPRPTADLPPYIQRCAR